MSTNSKMNSTDNLSIIHPDTIECAPTPISNMPFDESFELRNSDHNYYLLELDIINSKKISEKGDWDECFEREAEDDHDLRFKESIKSLYPPSPPTQESIDHDIIEKLTGNDTFYARKFYEVKDKIGDGEMKYIKDPNTREMLTNAWKAITFSNNWDFVAQDIESFMFSNNPKIDEISIKMEEFGYNGHSGASFGFTMRYMQFLVKNGEDKFKQGFILDDLEENI